MTIIHGVGFEVTLPNGSAAVCKAKLLFTVCDLPAKAVLMNCNQFNGRYGCSNCKNEGEQVQSGRGQTRVYRRTDRDQMRTHAKNALESGEVSVPITIHACSNV